MLQQNYPEDFVIASGVQWSVKQFIKFIAAELGIDIIFEGNGLKTIGKIKNIKLVNGKLLAKGVSVGDTIIRVDPRYFRPTEVENLLGDPTKAIEKLGWKPNVNIKEMCQEMLKYDLKNAERSKLLRDHGYSENSLD